MPSLLRLALDMPTGLSPIGGLPKDLNNLVVPTPAVADPRPGMAGLREWSAAITDLRTVVTPDPDGDNTGPNYGAKFPESDYAPIPRRDLPFGVPDWLDDDARGRQSRPKPRNSAERDSEDLLHTLIWHWPADLA